MSENEQKDKPSSSAAENGGDNPKPLTYPRGVFFILPGYLLERFTYYGLFGGVVFYLQRVLAFSASSASTFKAVLEGLIYLAPIAGAIVADTYWGKFRTVFVMCCCYTVGAVIFSLSSISPMMVSLGGTRAAGLSGIFILGLSAGFMKAVYSSLGPDQFKIPEQRDHQKRYFNAFYWMINAGAFFGQFLTAQMRESVQCFGDDCYMLPFLILCCLMVLSTLVFYSGRRHYIESPPDPMLLNSIKCIIYAAKKAISDRDKPVTHWIDRAGDKFDGDLIADVKSMLRVLMLFTTFPFFWALFYQTSTGMIFQAKRLHDRIGDYRIPPELTSSVNPLLIMMLIPLFEFVIYPLLARKNIFQSMISRMVAGMSLGCISFIIYGLINIQVEQTILGHRQAQLNIYNTRDCYILVSSDWLPEKLEIAPGKHIKIEPIEMEEEVLSHKMTFKCRFESFDTMMKLKEMHETTIVVFHDQIVSLDPTKHYLKNKDAEAKLRIISDQRESFDLIQSYKLVYGDLVESMSAVQGTSEFKVLSPQNYSVEYQERSIGQADIRQDGVYDLVVSEGRVSLFPLTAPSQTHMAWLIPQYLIITTGEVLFSVSSMDFSYTEAPTSMKSVMQAANLFTITVGLWVFAIITKLNAATNLYEYRASSEAFSYAVGMGINTVIFYFLTRRFIKQKADSVTDSPKIDTQGADNPAFQEEHKI